MKRITFSLLCAAILFGCEKEKKITPQPAAPTPYYVRLTDAPGPYTAVNVDIQGVEITVNGSPAMLNVNAGVYNLLDFANGADTLIATGNLIAEKVQQIRLILGPNNSVVVGGNTYPLSSPSAQQSGLKLQVHQVLEAGVAYEVLLDFDATQSIVEQGNGNYSLKPVIRTIQNAISGAIKGSVVPAGVSATVAVSSGTTTYGTVVNSNGDYIIKGLPAGVYNLTVTPVSPYSAATATNISVTTGITSTVAPLSI